MVKMKIYIDTSVIGGCFDKEFSDYSNALIKQFVLGRFIAVVSNITLEELQKAPEVVRRKIGDIPEENIEYVGLTMEAGDLAEKYIGSGVFNKEQLIDAQHIAIATVERVDVVVSWNFKHIVNLKRIFGVNSVNIREGYHSIEIRTPREVVDEK